MMIGTGETVRSDRATSLPGRSGSIRSKIFTSLALLQLGNALAVRSERESVFRLGLGSNPFLGWTVLGTLLVQLAILYWPPAQTALDLQPLTLGDLAIVLVASTTAFWAIEAEKLVSRLRASRRIPPGGPSRTPGTG
jgi:P-type Ca2+ transporter type 2C